MQFFYMQRIILFQEPYIFSPTKQREYIPSVTLSGSLQIQGLSPGCSFSLSITRRRKYEISFYPRSCTEELKCQCVLQQNYWNCFSLLQEIMLHVTI